MDAVTPAAPAGDEEGTSPRLALDGFSGSLADLLALARLRQIDLMQLSLVNLLDQLALALRDASAATPLGQKADWVVMAAWLVQLRSLLLLSPSSEEQAAELAADELRARLLTLQAMQALATWLDGRPQLGRDVFVRGQPEVVGTTLTPGHQIDVIEFLWASLALFDDDDDAEPAFAGSYRALWLDLHTIPEARDRILTLLAKTPDGASLDRLLPELTDAQPLRQFSAWASTFAASLELAKQGQAKLEQNGAFSSIHVRLLPVVADPGSDGRA